jgi:hypothetical protein
MKAGRPEVQRAVEVPSRTNPRGAGRRARLFRGARSAPVAPSIRVHGKPDQRRVGSSCRILKQEVTFTNTSVRSLDWNSYPILRFGEYPEVTPSGVQRIDQKSTGASEDLTGPTAAITKALCDATSVRLREYPDANSCSGRPRPSVAQIGVHPINRMRRAARSTAPRMAVSPPGRAAIRPGFPARGGSVKNGQIA